MSSFRTPWKTSSNINSRFSVSAKTKCIDITDPTLFPNLNGTIDVPSNTVQLDNPSTSITEEGEYSAPVRPWYIQDKEDTSTKDDSIKLGWILLTSDDVRKPTPKPIYESEPESDDDEDTMPMTTSKKPPKTKPEPYVELSSAQIMELFRLDVARHDRDVAEQENDPYEDYDDELEWNRDSDPYFSEGEEYMNEEDDEEYYEYDC